MYLTHMYSLLKQSLHCRIICWAEFVQTLYSLLCQEDGVDI